MVARRLGPVDGSSSTRKMATVFWENTSADKDQRRLKGPEREFAFLWLHFYGAGVMRPSGMNLDSPTGAVLSRASCHINTALLGRLNTANLLGSSFPAGCNIAPQSVYIPQEYGFGWGSCLPL